MSINDLTPVGSVAGDGTAQTVEFTVPADTREVYVRLNFQSSVQDTVIIKKLNGLKYNFFHVYYVGNNHESVNMGYVIWDDTNNTITVHTTTDLDNSYWVISIDAH